MWLQQFRGMLAAECTPYARAVPDLWLRSLGRRMDAAPTHGKHTRARASECAEGCRRGERPGLGDSVMFAPLPLRTGTHERAEPHPGC